MLTQQQLKDLEVISMRECKPILNLVREAVDALIKQRRLTHLSGELAKFEGSEQE